MQAFDRALGELAVDGLWGERTAFRTAFFAGQRAAPPSIAAEVPAWWRARRAAYDAKIESLLAKSSLQNREPAPPDVEVPAEVPAGVPDVLPRPGTVVSPDAPPVDVVVTPGPEAPVVDIRPPAKTNYFAWLGIAAVLGVGGFLVYRNMKPGRSTGRSSKKARRLQAAVA
jgi:hypothetical protein